jgi:hypothetical protein
MERSGEIAARTGRMTDRCIVGRRGEDFRNALPATAMQPALRKAATDLRRPAVVHAVSPNLTAGAGELTGCEVD